MVQKFIELSTDWLGGVLSESKLVLMLYILKLIEKNAADTLDFLEHI